MLGEYIKHYSNYKTKNYNNDQTRFYQEDR